MNDFFELGLSVADREAITEYLRGADAVRRRDRALAAIAVRGRARL